MRLLTWNLNGFRAAAKKGLEQILDFLDLDIVCFQEIKAMPEQIDLNEDLYPYQYINSARKKGYSGTMIASRTEPEEVTFGLGIEELDTEGRVITARFEKFTIVNVYTPNSKEHLARIDFRKKWDEAFAAYVRSLEGNVLICGDLNIARSSLDVFEVPSEETAGYSSVERDDFEKLLMPSFVDVFRALYPQKRQYSWWSYYSRGREKNEGWRIDYWLATPSMMERIENIEILDDVYGSDHCPVLLEVRE